MAAIPHRLKRLRLAALGMAVVFLAHGVRSATGALELPATQQMYAIYGGNIASEYYFYRIDVSTGVAKQIGNLHGHRMASLTADDQGTLYSWSDEKGLVTINPMTAAVTDVNPSQGAGGQIFLSMDFAPNGKLYGWASFTGLYEIDATSGATTFVAGTGLPPGVSPAYLGSIGGVEFVGDRLLGVIWSNDFNLGSPLIEMPLSDATSTLIGYTGVDALNSLAQDGNGKLYSLQSGRDLKPGDSSLLVTIDPATGAVTGTQAITPDALVPHYMPIALAIVTVPEPALVPLTAGLALVGMRRRWLRRGDAEQGAG